MIACLDLSHCTNYGAIVEQHEARAFLLTGSGAISRPNMLKTPLPTTETSSDFVRLTAQTIEQLACLDAQERLAFQFWGGEARIWITFDVRLIWHTCSSGLQKHEPCIQ